MRKDKFLKLLDKSIHVEGDLNAFPFVTNPDPSFRPKKKNKVIFVIYAFFASLLLIVISPSIFGSNTVGDTDITMLFHNYEDFEDFVDSKHNFYSNDYFLIDDSKDIQGFKQYNVYGLDFCRARVPYPFYYLHQSDWNHFVATHYVYEICHKPYGSYKKTSFYLYFEEKPSDMVSGEKVEVYKLREHQFDSDNNDEHIYYYYTDSRIPNGYYESQLNVFRFFYGDTVVGFLIFCGVPNIDVPQNNSEISNEQKDFDANSDTVQEAVREMNEDVNKILNLYKELLEE